MDEAGIIAKPFSASLAVDQEAGVHIVAALFLPPLAVHHGA
jgi:hypothetical protein